MKRIVFVIAVVTSLFLSIGCRQGSESDDKQSQTDETTTPPVNELPAFAQRLQNTPLSETKTGELISSKMLPLSQLNPETNEDIFVHVSGRVVNVNENETWAVIQDGDAYYFAFGHAGMKKIKKSFLGKQVYIRAMVDEDPLTEDILIMIQKNGLAPGYVPDSVVRGYRLNTKVAALVDGIDKEAFIALKK